MSDRIQRLIALVVAAVILAAGVAYAAARPATYESHGSLLLAPKSDTPASSITSLLDSFQRSGTSGTYVELISSKDTLDRAGVSGVGLTVRGVPDARTLQVTATGDRAIVAPALAAVIKASIAREAELGDPWQLRVLASPSAAAVSGPGKGLLLAATAVLALLGAFFVNVVIRRLRFGGAPSGIPAVLGSGGSAYGFDALPPPGTDLPPESQVSFRLQSFRYVAASTTSVLLQVAGYWRSELPRQLTEPVLLLHDGNDMHPLAAVSTPDNRPPVAGPATPLWRSSYAAPVEIFESYQRIALRAGPGVVVGLPHPSEQQIFASPEPNRADSSEPHSAGAPRGGDSSQGTDGREGDEPQEMTVTASDTEAYPSGRSDAS